MKAMPDDELGSWKRAVTCARGKHAVGIAHLAFVITLTEVGNTCGGSSKRCASAFTNYTAACRRIFHG